MKIEARFTPTIEGVEITVQSHNGNMIIREDLYGDNDMDDFVDNLIEVASEIREYTDKSLVDLVLDIVEKRMSAGEEEMLFKKLSER